MKHEFQIDYAGLLAGSDGASNQAKASILLERLPNAWRDAYLAMTPRLTELFIIPFGTFEYLFDDYATLELTGKVPSHPVFEARLVGVWGFSKPQRARRDDYRLKGWCGPTEKSFGREWDKGHFMAHSIGGAVDQCEMNVFVQLRSLNRGWSDAGKRFRQLEEYCFDHPGTFCFNRPIYLDGSARPAMFEFGLLKAEGELWVVPRHF